MKEYTCRACDNKFEYSTGKPGRPPVRCPECRAKSQQQGEESLTKVSSAERVDRLEFMLKSRGLHPSQWQEE